jgi:nitrous oxide reductase accessory protein NosL
LQFLTKAVTLTPSFYVVQPITNNGVISFQGLWGLFAKKGGVGLKFSLNARRWLSSFLVTAALVLLSDTAPSAGGGPLPALKPLSTDGQMQLSQSDRCPVCAMFPARRPDSAAAMSLKGGETFYFCGNGCLIRTWLRPMVYLGKPQMAIDHLVVLDYFSGQPIDARTATWVAGSDVVGPMGPAIIALGDAAQLDTFKNRHGGKTVFTFDQVDDALWKRISRHDLPAGKTD